MATTTSTVILKDGTPVEKQVSAKGVMYTLSQTTLKDTLNSIEGDEISAQRLSKKCLLLNGTRYYLGPSLVDKTDEEIENSADLISIQVSCKESEFNEAQAQSRPINWINCMFMPGNVTNLTFRKKH